jgi:hypothetical protein
MEEDNPLDKENIKETQDEDNDLQQTATKHPEWYSRKTFDQVTDVLCYTKAGDNPSNWKIALPKELIKPTVKWFKSQVILEARGFMNRYVRDITIVI